MFGNSLENLGKSTRECKYKHSDKFPKFLKIFGNLCKSSGKIGKCCKVLKTTFQYFFIFYEIFRNQKSSDVFRCLRKSSEICRKVLKITFQHFCNFFEIFGNYRKSLKIFGSLQKNSENVGKSSKRSSDIF